MLSGAYFALEGAKVVALPTNLGQSLQIDAGTESGLLWSAQLPGGETWLSLHASLPGLDILETSNEQLCENLVKYLKAAKTLNANFLKDETAILATTRLEFDRSWGLGSSSTLISLIAQWAGVNAFQLMAMTTNGSGYDVACATADGPILYHNHTGGRHVEQVTLNPAFKDQLLFIHLGQKQDTAEAISYFRAQSGNWQQEIEQVNYISEQLVSTSTLADWQDLFRQEEDLISKALDMLKVKDRLFADFPGVVKSLGAWGGDFVLALADQTQQETRQYFLDKGYHTMLAWDELILQP